MNKLHSSIKKDKSDFDTISDKLHNKGWSLNTISKPDGTSYYNLYNGDTGEDIKFNTLRSVKTYINKRQLLHKTIHKDKDNKSYNIYDVSCNNCGTDFEVSEKRHGKPPFVAICPNCKNEIDVN